MSKNKKEMEALNDEKLEQAAGGMIGSQYKGQKNYDSIGYAGIDPYLKYSKKTDIPVAVSTHPGYNPDSTK